MKLPRAGSGQVQQMGRFQAAQLPQPKMISAPNQRFIGQNAKLEAKAAGVGYDLVAEGLGQLGEAAFKWAEQKKETQVDRAKAEYLRSSTGAKTHNVNQPIWEIDEATGDRVYEWRQSDDRYSEFTKNERDRITQNMMPSAAKEFSLWAASVDTKNLEDINAYQREQELAVDWALNAESMDEAVRIGNLPEIHKIGERMMQSGFHDPMKVEKLINEKVDHAIATDVMKNAEAMTLARDSLTSDDINNFAILSMPKLAQITDLTLRRHAFNQVEDVMSWNDEMQEEAQDVNTAEWYLEAAKLVGDPGARQDFYQRFLETPKSILDQKYGDNLKTMTSAVEAWLTGSAVDDRSVMRQLDVMIADYKYQGIGHPGEIMEYLLDRSSEGKVTDQTFSEYNAAIQETVAGGRDKIMAKVMRDHETRWGMTLDDKGMHHYPDNFYIGNDADAGHLNQEILSQFNASRDALEAEVIRRSREGTLHEWMRSREYDRFIYDQFLRHSAMTGGNPLENLTLFVNGEPVEIKSVDQIYQVMYGARPVLKEYIENKTGGWFGVDQDEAYKDWRDDPNHSIYLKIGTKQHMPDSDKWISDVEMIRRQLDAQRQ